MSLNVSKHIIIVCAGKIEQSGLENRVVTPLESTIIDCRSAVVERMDLSLGFESRFCTIQASGKVRSHLILL